MSELRQKCFWLLLAATIAVDCTAVICWWNVSRPVNWDELYPTCVSTALALGQVSVIGIWLAFRGRHDAWSYIVPAIAIGIAAIVRSKLWVFGGFTLTDFACRTALQMLGTLFGLRLIQRTPIWRRLSPGSLSSRWEFSMRQLLIWMTSIAIFFGLVARSTWSDGQFLPLTEATGIFAPPATAIGVVFVAQLRIGWIFRLCGYIVIGAIVATILAQGRREILLSLNFEFILEAIIIAIWVELGGIVPHVLTTSITNGAT